MVEGEEESEVQGLRKRRGEGLERSIERKKIGRKW